MKEKQTYDLYIFKKATFTGNCLGFAILLFSIIKDDFSFSLVLSFLGLGIMIASMVTFGFGMFLNLLSETSDKSKGNNTYPCKDNIYYFLENKRYYYK